MPKRPSRIDWFLGIDPGKQGGLVLLSTRGEIEWHQMPPSVPALWELVSSFRKIKACALERVHSMPGEGHKGAFTFGYGFGCLNTSLVAAELKYKLVRPQDWQKYFGMKKFKGESKGHYKDRLLELAKKRHPDLELWTTPRTLGVQRAICDALLLADYSLHVLTL